MNSQQFLLLNIAILSIFIIWFLAGRRGGQKKPTSLNMKRGNESKGGVLQTTQSENSAVGRYSHPKFQKFLEGEKAGDPADPKELNTLFNYNGHTWDAYEVLGVPAGASLVEVTRAYQILVKSSAVESHEFLETAYRAILAKS